VYDAHVAVNIMLADVESTEKRYATWMGEEKHCLGLIKTAHHQPNTIIYSQKTLHISDK
jgi:hypothetical protein